MLVGRVLGEQAVADHRRRYPSPPAAPQGNLQCRPGRAAIAFTGGNGHPRVDAQGEQWLRSIRARTRNYGASKPPGAGQFRWLEPETPGA